MYTAGFFQFSLHS